MDKYEYKIKEDEIKELIKMQEFEEAAEVADTIDWRRVKSVKVLCIVSDVYKKLRRYEDSRDMLLLAYDRHPGGRTIVYSLCELAIKMGDLGQALEYCKEFIQLAPKDPGRYILQYKLYEAQEVRLEERITVLEELKKRDYREKWAYELAYLYHQVGMETKCVEECDELIVWFGEGRYVIKAMELKMLHQPLTPEQQEKYDNRFAKPEPELVEEPAKQEKIVPAGETIRIPAEDIDIQVKPLGLGKCDTINLQAEVAAGLKEYLDTQDTEDVHEERDIDFEMANTAEFMMGVLETAEIIVDKKAEAVEETESAEEEQEIAPPVKISDEKSEEVVEETAEETAEESEPEQESVPEEASTPGEDSTVQKPEELEWQAGEMAKVLSVEGDGQISFVVPETIAIEKQITGQMNFSDIMLEWERMKLELEEKRKENVRQMVLKNTGSMFTEFEASVRDGLLEQLENGKSMEEILPKAENLTLEDTEVATEEAEETFTEDAEGFEEIIAEEIPEEEEIGEAENAFEELGEIVENDEEAEPQVVVEAESKPDEDDGVEEIAFTVEDIEEPEAEETIEAEAEPEPEETPEPEAEPEPEEIPEPEAEPEPEETPESEAEPEEEEVLGVEESEPEAELQVEEAPEAEEEPEVEGEPEDDEPATEEESEEIDAADTSEKEEDAEEELPQNKGNYRKMTKEERELFAPFIQGRDSKEQLLRVLDTISLAAYTGNVVITGREGLDTIGLARSIIRNLQQEDKNFSGKVAKISGNSLNKRNIPEIVEGLINGALIVQRAGDINESTAKSLYKVLQQETRGIVIILEGTKRAINAFFEKYSILEPCFNARIDMEALSNEALVNFAKKYAREQECSIDEFGMLALHRTIAERQTSDHAVTIMEVKDIMDAAIESANRKTIGHFFSILAAKRYDDEDMIIIREKDFM